jgi:hypothetical protein
MHEWELANLYVRTGLERGIPVDQLTSELTALPLPSWIRGQEFRAALLDVAEAQLRKQVEDQISRLRHQLGGAQPPLTPGRSGSVAGAGRPGVKAETPEDTSPPSGETASEDASSTMVVEDDLPGDATMIWETRRG